jgi:crotonobetainyl-CoA:carnitine CoA-transferase CaiB-like acyl-CoA transferase
VPVLGATRTVGNLVTLSETPGSVKGGPPLLGEANDEILRSLGFTPEEIAAIGTRAQAVREQAFALLAAMNDPRT